MAGSGSDGDFSISYPIDFDESEMMPPLASTEWRWNESEPGNILLKIEIPRAIESQTNFDGATLTVGRSTDPKAIADCLKGDTSSKISKATLNGVAFVVSSGSDSGMSHYHDITSYRALHGGKCYAIEYTIASTALGAYDPSLGLKAFNEGYMKAILDRIVGTFRFR
jgi:hypothetical protein